MCILCDQGKPQTHGKTQLGRRDFLKASTAAAAGAGAMGLFTSSTAQAHDDGPPQDTGHRNRRYVIRGGHVMSMDPAVGDFVKADVLVEGRKIEAVRPNIHTSAQEIDARGKIVMPGFVDTHHHQAWTAIRSSIPDSILINDGTGTPSAQQNYFFNVLGGFDPSLPGFANHYRPEDVYISELFGGLSQLDAGVTTVLDISQIHHSPRPLRCGHQGLAQHRPSRHDGLLRERRQHSRGTSIRPMRTRFAGNLSGDDLVGFVMGGEVYLGERDVHGGPGRSPASSAS